jgi:hypothetical protein
MSKMRLSKIAAVLLAVCTLAACARQLKPDDPNVRGIGYVRLEDAIKLHPLYPQLAQLQDSIDALNLKALGAAAVPQTPEQIAKATAELNRELKQAQERANAILRQKQQDYQTREQAAIRAALGAAGAGTNGNAPVSAMQNVTAQQAQQVATQANADFQAYQQSVIAQDNAAVRQINLQLQARANDAYRQKATQLQEKESQLSLELSQQDAAKRLDLRMKLGNLAMGDAQRKQYRDELAALDANEAAAVDAQRKRDQQELAAYRTQLRAQMQRDIVAQTEKVHAATQAKLQARHNEVTQQVASQLQGLQPAAIPSNLPAATRSKLQQIDQQYKAQFQADAQKTIDQYQTTKADLDAQYAALQGADGAATGAAGRELADLQRQRDDLYNRMVDQVKRDAATAAAKRGLQVVFISVVAAPGGIDLTDDVEKDIESLHQ